jgi:signal transduction histidine kinase
MRTLKHGASKSFKYVVTRCLIASIALVLLTVLCDRLHFNLATSVLLYVIVVTLLARTGCLVSSILASIIAALSLLYVVPPANSFRVSDPLDVLAIGAFFLVALTIAFLVSKLRRMAEEALSTVDRRLIDAEERERARIGRDLHDDIGQRMALLQVNLERLRSDVPNATVAVLKTLDDLGKQMDELSSDIHGLAQTLYSRKIEQIGLVKTMSSFCKEFAHRQKVQIEFRTNDLQNPPSLDVSLSLFRVLQEALRNSAKHSGARQFEVELFEAADAFHLSVRDSGFGFDSAMAMNGTGLGLISMQERIKLVKGELSIDSQLNRGTRIHARVPIITGNISHAQLRNREFVA